MYQDIPHYQEEAQVKKIIPVHFVSPYPDRYSMA